MLRAFSIFLLFVSFISLYSQNKNEYLDVNVQTSGLFSGGDNAPFWQSNNENGIASEKNNSGYLRAGVFGGKSFNSKLNLSFGADFLTSYNLEADIYIQQLYADLKYRSLGLSAGMKERYSPFRNSRLSSGTFSLSNNARPIPQIEIGLPDFTPVPFTKKMLQVMGGVSYGWFLDNKFKERYAGDGNYVKSTLFHRKYVYLRFQNHKSWDVVFGLDMSAQWGGDLYKKGEYSFSNPEGIGDMFKVLFNASGGSNASGGDQINKLGNSFGSWHLVFNYRTGKYSFRIYNEHFFEDKSGVVLRNMPDGIYGAEFNFNKKDFISSILFELLYAKNHTGPWVIDENGNNISDIAAADDYYNNFIYVSATNYGYVLGNPLFVSPIYNDRKTLAVLNNIIMSYHGGISGYLCNDLSYRLLLTYTRAYGSSRMPETWRFSRQFSTMLELTYNSPKLENWLFTGSFAYDNSSEYLVGDNFGFRFKVSKSFNIR